ncbi:DUF5131 family protein [Sulfuritortus calidifontis]|nr:DUF5131 family protein [Sulfuritortus calidifontis]
MATSDIEWTEQTWNPVTGCTKVSPVPIWCRQANMAPPARCEPIKSRIIL